MKPFSLLLLLFLVSLSTQQNCPTTKQTILDSPIRQLEWFNDEQYIYAVTETSVYVSHDEGQSWTKQPLGPGTTSKLFLTASENKQIVLEYNSGKPEVWITEDHGTSWKLISLPSTIWTLYPHPSDSDWIVAHTYSSGCLDGKSECSYDLIISKDFGGKWSDLSKSVRTFSWGSAGLKSVPKETAYQLRTESFRKYKYERTQNLFKSVDGSVSDAVAFGYFYGTLYVAQYVGDSLKLLVSNDEGATLKPARFPTTLDEHSYTIIDGIEGLSYIAVDHTDFGETIKWANVYVTDFTSDSYVLSQEFVPKDNKGKVDFSTADIDGIQIANVYYVKDEPLPSDETEIVSVVTFDNGGRWQYMEPPVNSCTSKDCKLHLQGHSTEFDIETSPSAVGLIMGTGNTGDTLDDEVLNTYISRDAGLTWNFLYSGSKIYQFSDHGGLILLGSSDEAVGSVLYSWDQGKSFTNCSFSTEFRDIDFIGTAPSGTSQNYIIVQSDQSSGQSILTHLDFSSLHEVECTEKDYEWWRPSDGSDEYCLLGREISFKRRKQDVPCFNPEDYEKEQIVSVCPCTEEDYGCDFCYQESQFEDDSSKCILYCDYDPASPPTDCKESYTKTQGYRLVAGDQCEGGLNLNPQVCDCNGENCKNTIPVSTTGTTTGGTGGGSSSGTSPGKVIGVIFLLLLIFVILAAGLIYYLYHNNDEVRKYVDEHVPKNWFGRQSNRPDVAYHNLEQPGSDNVEVDPFVDEEEATELADQDIVQMKTLNVDNDADFNPRDDPSQPPSLI